MTIQERALKAWERRQCDLAEEEKELTAQELEKRQRTAKEVAARFEKWYGEPADKTEGTEYYGCADIHHDGLHLWGYTDDPEEFFLTLSGTCPKCGEEVESDAFTTLWELGHLLEEGFRPADWHYAECEGGDD